jgi:hypothetical protein
MPIGKKHQLGNYFKVSNEKVKKTKKNICSKKFLVKPCQTMKKKPQNWRA